MNKESFDKSTVALTVGTKNVENEDKVYDGDDDEKEEWERNSDFEESNDQAKNGKEVGCRGSGDAACKEGGREGKDKDSDAPFTGLYDVD